MGRPPIGNRPMTSTERSRRRRAGLASKPATKPAKAATKPKDGLGQRSEGQVTRRHREERGRPVEFTEIGKLRAEIVTLKSDIIKLKTALQEEPDVAKLRKKVINQQVEMASLRQALRKVVKERDKAQARLQPKPREAQRLLTRQNYGDIIKALHPDRIKHCTPIELATAVKLVTGLRPLFDEH